MLLTATARLSAEMGDGAERLRDPAHMTDIGDRNPDPDNLPDQRPSLWFLVLVLVGLTSLSTLLPSGPAVPGTLQFAYALAIEFVGGRRDVGIAAATPAQLCLLLPVALVATGVLVQGSGRLRSPLLKGRSSDAEDTRPASGARGAAGP